MGSEGDQSTREGSPESGADETRQRILQAAARVFAEQGYARATTRTLAAAAGVNEVTLFRHFGSKQNLFAEVIDAYAAPALVAALEGQLVGDYHHDLMAIGRHVMQVLLQRRQALRLMLCEAEHFPEVREVMAQNPRQLRQLLARYLERQMVQGRVRQGHAEALAQAFWGMFFAYAISVEFLAERPSPGLSTEEVVAQFVDVFTCGTAELGGTRPT